MYLIQMCVLLSLKRGSGGRGGGHLDDLLGICLFSFRFIRLWRLKHLKPYAVFAPFVILFTIYQDSHLSPKLNYSNVNTVTSSCPAVDGTLTNVFAGSAPSAFTSREDSTFEPNELYGFTCRE